MDADVDANTIRFLVTTDNHLGFMDRDPRRGDDSFVTFEEALAVGRVEYDCDAVLLGGDLFHDNKPSLSTITRTMALFRRYVLGSKPVAIQLLSDPALTFPTHPAPLANFQDPNMNVAMPVFIIHGNHDDPIGGVSAIDTLATAGLVNYFGHTQDLDDIVVRPVLLRKGTTRVAVYGLGNVRDERLHRCFTLGKVRFVRPRSEPRGWFNILLLHQNRGCRGGPNSKGGLNEEMLLGFGFDLVIWGNEHEQRMTPTSVGNALEIIQPGSTIMTSLSAAESNPKQCGVLEVNGTAYRLTPHTLRSVRPVVRRTLELWREPTVTKTLDSVEEFLRKATEDMLVEAEEKIARIPDAVLRKHPHLKFPLLRLAVDFSDPQGAASFPSPNLNRFGQQFLDIVVNPGELLKAVKPKAAARHAAHAQLHDPNARDLHGILAPEGEGGDGTLQNAVTTDDIRTKIAQVFSANAKDSCTLLSEPEISHAVHSFVEKGERAAIEEAVEGLLQGAQRHIWKTVRENVNDVTRVLISDLSVKHKQEKNKQYFERFDELQRSDTAAAGGGGVSEGSHLPPPPPPPLAATTAGGFAASSGGLGLAARSAAALSDMPLGGIGGGGGGAAGLLAEVVDVDGDDDDEEGRPAAAGAAPSGAAAIVAAHAAGATATKRRSTAAAATAAPAADGAAAAAGPKRGRGAASGAAKGSARKQPPPAGPASGAPQLATTSVATTTAAVMSRWAGAGGA